MCYSSVYMSIKKKLASLLRWSEKYTKTDMVYLAKGGFWINVEKGALMLISIATMAAFANWLPQEVYGEYQFVISVAGIVGILSLPGLTGALVRSVAKGREGALRVAFKTQFLWSLVASGVMVCIAGWYFVHENNTLAVAFAVASLVLPIKYASPLFLSYWAGKKRFDVHMATRVSADLAIAVVVIATLFLTDELWVVVAAFFGGTALFYWLGYVYSQNRIENGDEDEGLVSFGKHLTVMQIVGTIAKHLDTIILWKVLGPVQVAIYTFSLKPIQKVKGIIPIEALALPKLSESGVRTVKQKKSVFRKFLLLFLVTVPTAVGIALAAPFLYQLVFPQYMESVVYFQAFTVLLATQPFALLGTALVAEKKVAFMYITKTVAPVIKIGLFLILTPLYGIGGIIAAFLVTEIVRGMLGVYFFWKM